MTPLQLALIGTVHMLTHVLLEIPTGVVADVFSRRASVIAGGLLIGIGFMLIGTVPLFIAALIASIIKRLATRS